MAKSYTISTDELSSEVQKILKDYTEEVYAVQREIAEEVSKDCADDLHHAGSFGGTKYRRSWTFKPQTIGHKIVSFVVYNEKHYRLTHLLEDGHRVVNGKGDTGVTTRAFPHIEPMEQKYIKEFEKRLKEAIQG